MSGVLGSSFETGLHLMRGDYTRLSQGPGGRRGAGWGGWWGVSGWGAGGGHRDGGPGMSWCWRGAGGGPHPNDS